MRSMIAVEGPFGVVISTRAVILNAVKDLLAAARRDSLPARLAAAAHSHSVPAHRSGLVAARRSFTAFRMTALHALTERD